MSDFRWHVYQEDCLAVLKRAPADYFDAMVTDPPAGVKFMGIAWDTFDGRENGGRTADKWDCVGGNHNASNPQDLARTTRAEGKRFRAFMTRVMEEAMRCLKPGAHCLVWALPRTSHWTATALEDAGFEVRDCLTHHFGSGFPKSADVSKAIDKLAGAEREVVGTYATPDGRDYTREARGKEPRFNELMGKGTGKEPRQITAPVTSEAEKWSGYGTALKPATEHWILCRKPLAATSIARNVLAHGTGALNIDACRVNRASDDVPGWHKTGANGSLGYQSEKCPDCVGGEPCPRCGGTGWLKGTFAIREMTAEEIQERCGNKGRWPTNLVLSHSADCRCVGADRVKANGNVSGQEPSAKTADVYGSFAEREAWVAHGNGDGTETVEVWECAADCPVAELDRQSGDRPGMQRRTLRRGATTGTSIGGHDAYGTAAPQEVVAGYSDSGGASRFFPTFRYQAKPSRSEKEAGLDSLPTTTLNRVNPGGIEHDPRWAPVQVKNNHPTVKSVALMRWLCRLITPPGGLVLDPFCGSGSTGVACMKEGFRFIGIEQDAHYCEIAGARIAAAESKEEETDGRRTE